MAADSGSTPSWFALLWRARAPAFLLALAAVALILLPQTADMIVDLSDPGAGSWRPISFHVAMAAMALAIWYWARASLRAWYGRGARGVALVPALLFLGAAGVAAAAAYRSLEWTQLEIVGAWAAGLFVLLLIGMRAGGARAPSETRGGVWGRLHTLLDHGPGGARVAGWLLGIASALFAISAALSFVPGATAWATLPARWFAGPGAALLLLGFAAGPLAAIAYVADRTTEQWTRYLRPPVIVILLLMMLLGSLLTDLHSVRIVNDPGALSPNKRLLLSDAFAAWLSACAPNDGTPVRPVIVAVSGGASRAALWGARVMKDVDADIAANGAKGASIFAVSSVSGGSLGAAAYLSLRAGQAEKRADTVDGGCTLSPLSGAGEDARDGDEIAALRADAIGPALAGMLFGDAPRGLVGFALSPFSYYQEQTSRRPWVFRGNDRAEALERAFEQNWTREAVRPMTGIAGAPPPVAFDRPYLSLFYDGNGQYRRFVPLWIANGTDENTGDRLITAPFKFNHERFGRRDGAWRLSGHRGREAFTFGRFGPFQAARDVLALLQADVPISTAIDNTARFPFISPSGELTPRNPRSGVYSAQIIDGGYFENEGLISALELADWLRDYGPTLAGRPVLPIVVEATADADAGIDERQIVRCGNPGPENPRDGQQSRSVQFLVPVLGLNAVRTGHSHLVLKQAAEQYCNQDGHQSFFHFYLYNAPDFDVPLNWVLSSQAADYIWDKALDACGNAAEQLNFDAEFQSGGGPQARPELYTCVDGQPQHKIARPPPLRRARDANSG